VCFLIQSMAVLPQAIVVCVGWAGKRGESLLGSEGRVVAALNHGRALRGRATIKA